MAEKIKTRWQWKLRFKSAMAPSRGVWDVCIESNSSDYDNAKKVADDYLTVMMPHPSTRFVMLEPFVAYSEDEMLRRRRLPGGPDAETSPAGEGSHAADLQKSAPLNALPPDASERARGARVGQ